MGRNQQNLRPWFRQHFPLVIALTGTIGPSLQAQDFSDLPSLDDILDTDSSAVPSASPDTATANGQADLDSGQTAYHPISGHVAEQMGQVALPVDANERQELSTWVKWLVLKNLPANHEDVRKWNRQKEVVSGLDVKMDGLRLDTKRRRKLVNHGTWSRYNIEFVDPQQQLIVDITKIEFPSAGQIDIQCRVETPLKLFGRLSQWQRDVQLYSVSVDGRARVEMVIDAVLNIQVNPLKFPPDVEFLPVVNQAKVNLKEFEIDRVSRVGGDAAELLGKALRKTLDRKIEEYDTKVAEKMNKEIAKQRGRLKLSLSDWASKKLSGPTN